MKQLLPLLYKAILLLFVTFIAQNGFSQKKEYVGTLKDSVDRKPIEGAVVQILDQNNKIIAFGTTDKEGNYKLSLKSESHPSQILFRHISYELKKLPLRNIEVPLQVRLSPQSITIREVNVKAPKITMEKDTISYSVNSFKSATDRSIEDVIKKLPGVEVAKDGKISYQGKSISKFNIEGLDLLGGKYTLASRNIQAKDVARVEIVENYQEVKQLIGKGYSEQVAMNLKLKDEAKMRLIGTMELGGGYRIKELLYHGVITGMMFNKNSQFIGVAKTNNIGNPLSAEINNHFGNNPISLSAIGFMDDNIAQWPPFSMDRHCQKNDVISSANTLFKLPKDQSLRLSVDHNYLASSFRYQSTSEYYDPSGNIFIEEKSKPEFSEHTVNGHIGYTLNSSSFYLSNQSYFRMRWADNDFGMRSNERDITQNINKQLAGISNNLYLYKRTGKKNYSIQSQISFSDFPKGNLTIRDVTTESKNISQKVGGKGFRSYHGSSFGYDINSSSKIDIGVGIKADWDRITTTLERGDSTILNHNEGFNIVASVNPTYRLEMPNRRYGVSVGIPSSFHILNFKNRINRNADFSLYRPFFNPNMNGFYQFSPFLKLSLSGGFYNYIGDIANFVTLPVQTSYLSSNSRTGILSKNQSLSSRLNLEYKNPLKTLFINGGISYGINWRNILASQNISVGGDHIDLSWSGIADRNSSDNWSFNGSISKEIDPIRTSLSIWGNYGISSGTQLRQGVKTEVNGNYWSISPRIRTRITRQIEATYSMNYNQSAQRSIDYKTVSHQQRHEMNLSYTPIKSVSIYGSIDFSRHEMAPHNYINLWFSNVGATYAHKKFELELKLNNLFDTRQFSYTRLNNLDRFTYSFNMNPREILLITKFSL